jgi:flagellar basal-body rod protein FlgF
MSGSIYLAASGAMLEQMRLEVLANNIANVGTPGFKQDLPIFRVSAPSQDPLAASTGTGEDSTAIQEIQPYTPPFDYRTDFSTGALQKTGNPLDLALVGNGFFVIRTPEGERYTRQGSFRLNDEGVLCSQDGYPVLGQGGEIAIDGRQVAVGQDGSIEVDGQQVAKLRLVNFSAPENLRKVGSSLFVNAAESGANQESEATDVQVDQGFIETSNVNAIRAMTDMIECLRVSEAYQKVIRSADEATAQTINDVGSV